MSEVLGVRHTVPQPALPPGSCDCHVHVIGPANRFGFDPGRSYTPGDAVAADLQAHQHALGLDRVVIVHPSIYGTDNAATLDGVRQLGDCARAVAVIPPGLGQAELHTLHAAGVRGIRLNLEQNGQSNPVVAGEMLRRAAEQVQPLGWHVQIYTNMGVLAALHGMLGTLPVPLVVDHFGRAMAADGVGQPGFQTLLGLVRGGQAYVKLSAAHRIAPNPDDAEPIATALIAANPERMLWGSDWPHPGGARRGEVGTIEPFNPVDDGAALNRLRRWAGSQDVFHTILVDNPARLYDFP